jgi:hypothetical protein
MDDAAVNRDDLDGWFARADDVLTDWHGSPDAMNTTQPAPVRWLTIDWSALAAASEAMATHMTAMAEATLHAAESLGRLTHTAYVLPGDAPPLDPWKRALEARRTRNTGPPDRRRLDGRRTRR